ncbi:coproporphyrinogen III oxidase [Mycobacterium tuberculosis]|nr:coproporphyrinogen III oxidase [Mycobacterium tuberculosis]
MVFRQAPVELPGLAPMPGQPFGVYLHVPFCLTRCGYCDFNTYTPAQLGGVSPDRWLLALRAELELAAAKLDAPTVHTVYVGGGTPSLLGGERLATLLDMVRDHFVLAPDAEVSTEANPESTWPEFFATIRAAGYTRVSLGMQSVAPRVLATLDRVHSPGRAAAAATEAIAEGFTHVNLDLIYGTPGESDDDLVRSVDAAVQAGVDHVSAYALVVEHGTALARRVRRVSWPRPMTTCWRIATSWSMLGCRRPGLPGTRCPIGVDRAASAGTTWVIGTVASGGAQVRARTATLA